MENIVLRYNEAYLQSPLEKSSLSPSLERWSVSLIFVQLGMFVLLPQRNFLFFCFELEHYKEVVFYL
jgi:hypothetical protein